MQIKEEGKSDRESRGREEGSERGGGLVPRPSSRSVDPLSQKLSKRKLIT